MKKPANPFVRALLKHRVRGGDEWMTSVRVNFHAVVEPGFRNRLQERQARAMRARRPAQFPVDPERQRSVRGLFREDAK